MRIVGVFLGATLISTSLVAFLVGAAEAESVSRASAHGAGDAGMGLDDKEREAGAPAPVITSVIPNTGPLGGIWITLVGSGFPKTNEVQVRFGSVGAAGVCGSPEVINDKLMICQLPKGVGRVGDPFRFVVVVANDGGLWKSSDTSTATYTPLTTTVADASISPTLLLEDAGHDAGQVQIDETDVSDYVQVHVVGSNLGVFGGTPPATVVMVTAAEGGNEAREPCEDVFIIGENELVCYVWRANYKKMETRFEVVPPSTTLEEGGDGGVKPAPKGSERRTIRK